MLVGTVGNGRQVHMVRREFREFVLIGYSTVCPARRTPGYGQVVEGEQRELTCKTCLRILAYSAKTRKGQV